MSGRPAVFLDRDGVLNALVPQAGSGVPESPLHADDVLLLPGAAAAVLTLADAGFLLIGASNQPAAAKGTVTRAELDAVQARVLSLLAAQGATLDDFYICWHHPDGSDPQLGGECDCRKPAPGMLLEAARAHGIDLGASWMVGDTDADVLAGTAAGTRTVLIEHPPSAHKRTAAAMPTLRAADLRAAVALLADQPSR